MARLMAICLACRAAQATRTAPRFLSPGAGFYRGLAGGPRMVASAEAPATTTLDERLVAEEPELVKSNLRLRRAAEAQLDAVDRIGALTRERASLVKQANRKRALRKQLSPKIGRLLKAGEAAQADALKAEVASAAAEVERIESQIADVEAERGALFVALPNMLDPRVDDGADEAENTVVSLWGVDGAELPRDRRWHDELGTELGMLDLEAASKLSGARFAVLRGSLARLERALINFFLDTHTEAHGYTEAAVPLIVGSKPLQGTGQLPKFEDDLFRLAAPLNGRNGYLIPTAEVPLTNLHAETILDEAQLPLSYVAATPCFRAEAGSHGKDTRGLFRQHQFHKVELVKICTPEQSDAQHHALVEHAESCLRELGLPYRKVRLCSGDIGFSSRLCYDLEVWLPAQVRGCGSHSHSAKLTQDGGHFSGPLPRDILLLQLRRLPSAAYGAALPPHRAREQQQAGEASLLPHDERIGPRRRPHPRRIARDLPERRRLGDRTPGAQAVHGRARVPRA